MYVHQIAFYLRRTLILLEAMRPRILSSPLKHKISLPSSHRYLGSLTDTETFITQHQLVWQPSSIYDHLGISRRSPVVPAACHRLWCPKVLGAAVSLSPPTYCHPHRSSPSRVPPFLPEERIHIFTCVHNLSEPCPRKAHVTVHDCNGTWVIHVRMVKIV